MLADVVKNRILQHYGLIRPFLPNRYMPFSVNSSRIYLNIKESSMMMARALGKYESGKKEAVRSHVYGGSFFVDVGANKGDFSLLAASLGAASVLCIEPEASNCDWIRRSIALNGYKSIQVMQLALSDRNGRAQLHLGSKSGFHSLISGLPDRECGTVEVETRTLDSLCTNRRVDVVKIDVEGAEMRVLRGAEQTLRENQDIVLLIDLHPHLGANNDELATSLRESGFGLYRMYGQEPVSEHEIATAKEVLARRS